MSRNLKIKETGKGTIELEFGGEPVDLTWLKEINLNMDVVEGNTLTLKYGVEDVEVETHDIQKKEFEE